MENINSKVFKELDKKIKYLNKKFASDLTKNLVNKGQEKLSLEYSFDLSVQNIDVGSEIINSNKGQVYAKGEEVSYIEFGTGKVGEKSNYPKEKLPKQSLVFESPKGHIQNTLGWVYYYENKYTKRKNKQGRYGWYYKKNFTRGMPAGKQMYNTANYLRDNISNIAKETIKENLK